jgi:hypothetical protein
MSLACERMYVHLDTWKELKQERKLLMSAWKGGFMACGTSLLKRGRRASTRQISSVWNDRQKLLSHAAASRQQPGAEGRGAGIFFSMDLCSLVSRGLYRLIVEVEGDT